MTAKSMKKLMKAFPTVRKHKDSEDTSFLERNHAKHFDYSMTKENSVVRFLLENK